MFKKLFKKLYSVLLCAMIIFVSMSIQSESASKKLPTIDQSSVVGKLSKSSAYLIYKSFFKNVDDSFIIPGLKSNMCPQGLCEAGDYILISAYDPYKKYNSCIHVVKKSTGKYVKTVWLKDNNYHAGGIACDGTNVYVANSTKGTLSKLSLSQITKAKNKATVTWKSVTVKNEKKKKITASFCSYDSNRNLVWVGVFNKEDKDRAYGYSISGTTAKLKEYIQIPKKTQGMYFNGKDVYFSTSWGMILSSKIYKYTYSYSQYTNNKYIDYYTHKKTISAPPGSQNIFVYNGRLYILFESAAKYHYKKGFFNPVDRVCKYKKL